MEKVAFQEPYRLVKLRDRTALSDYLMDKSGFTGLAQEIPSAVAMVKNLYIWGAVVAWALIAIIMFAYKLDKKYDGIMADMERKGMLKQAD